MMSKSVNNPSIISEFSIVTTKGRKPLGEYLREAPKRLNKSEYSLIIPAYNEGKRLPKMLTETIAV